MAAFVLGDSDYGYGALIGGPAGLLGAFAAIYFLRRRRSVNGKPD
ncbi:LPXTG cell wall anchor domain-containing protein [Blastococcus brunescens]|uniref:LPXTG cell wall anchor domain-containing protein n=1 Tax=Blastococcus brunescens TaxID=1564165 RepID=A0ABZ1B6T0_9ACTN|nr:LPXTG cell wall anchor domain-containing protein [Blastococcus sp. BMG 8361]WRL65558.1 LPXTG cell wall anchor domain-containing protein [Blastococcus sp. BMG 8361]